MKSGLVLALVAPSAGPRKLSRHPHLRGYSPIAKRGQGSPLHASCLVWIGSPAARDRGAELAAWPPTHLLIHSSGCAAAPVWIGGWAAPELPQGDGEWLEAAHLCCLHPVALLQRPMAAAPVSQVVGSVTRLNGSQSRCAWCQMMGVVREGCLPHFPGLAACH